MRSASKFSVTTTDRRTLINELLDVVASLSGADFGYLLLARENGWWIESGGELSSEAVEEALTELNLTLPPHKRIRRFQVVGEVFSAENGLLTTNLKLRRAVIATHFADEVEALYARESVGSGSGVL